MSGVDNRIVTMQFNNSEFERNAKTSLTTLQKIKESMNFSTIAGASTKALGGVSTMLGKIGLSKPFDAMIRTASSGFSGIGTMLGKIGLHNPFASTTQGVSDLQRASLDAAGPNGVGAISGAVTGVSGKFIAMSTVAITAIANITNRMVNAAATWLKSFTVSPILDGLHEYETTLQSIQTVQANTDAPLKEVEDSLKRLNDYSDTTIYNFGQMAKNVGTFTAAGVDLETSVASIQGIANIAALSGSSAEQAATAMYQLSQAIASGKVGLMDWNSVVNAGMGGKKLQNALAQTAIAMGEIEASSVKLVGPMKKLEINGDSFRESIMAKPGEESWLSSDILVNTLASLDGRFSVAYQKAQLTEQGVRKFTDAQIKSNMAEARANLEKKNGVKFSDEQYAALLKMAEASTKAAQDVKTLGQVFDIAKETIGSGWAASFKSIFGNLDESKKLFTGMSNGLGDLIRKNALARNELLAAWKDRGGRDTLIDGLHNAWVAFSRIMKPLKNAFHDIFPKTTVNGLLDMTAAFENFTEKLIPSKKTMADIRDIAGGVFAAFHIGIQIIGAIVDGIQALFGAVGGGKGDFLDFGAGIGNMVKDFDAWLEKSGVLTDFFTGLGEILAIPIKLITTFAGVLGDMFSGSDVPEAVGEIDVSLGRLGDRFGWITDLAKGVASVFGPLFDFLGNVGSEIGKALSGMGDAMAQGMEGADFSGVFDVLNVGILAAIGVFVSKVLKDGVSVDLSGGLIKRISGTFDQLTANMKAMQTQIQAKTLLMIAGAIALLTASVVALSLIDSGKLTKALSAMAVGFGQLLGAMAILVATTRSAGFVKIPLIAGAMVLLAGAVLVLVASVAVLSRLSWNDLAKGLAGVGALLLMISVFANTLGGSVLTIGALGLAMIPLATGIAILTGAVMVLSTMKWEELAKGLAGLAGMLTILVVALNAMSGGIVGAAAILIIAPALLALIPVLQAFGNMSWKEIGKAMTVLAGAMTILVIALNTMSGGILGALALLIITPALLALIPVMKSLGKMKWEAIGKGLVALAGSLLILAVGLTAMVAALPGAVALLVVAPALMLLVGVLAALGNMDWGTILKGLGALALIFAVLGISALLLAPLTPVIIGLGIALLAVGAGMALAGVGALAFAEAIKIFGEAAPGAAEGVKKFLALLPDIATAFVKALVAVTVAIGEGSGEIVAAIVKLVGSILDGVIKLIPKLEKVLDKLIGAGLRVLRSNSSDFTKTGFKLITDFIDGLGDNMKELTDKGARVIIKFLEGIQAHDDEIAKEGVATITSLARAMKGAITDQIGKMFGNALDLGQAIINGIKAGLSSLLGSLKDAAVNVVSDAYHAAKDWLLSNSPSKRWRDGIGKPMAQGAALGIRDGAGDVADEAVSLNQGVYEVLRNGLSDLGSMIDTNLTLDPTITPVLDLTALTKEANKMSSIFETSPIIPRVSFAAASEISVATQSRPPSDDDSSSGGGNDGGGDTHYNYTQILQSPKPIDSVESYRRGRSLIAQKKMEVSTIKREEDE